MKGNGRKGSFMGWGYTTGAMLFTKDSSKREGSMGKENILQLTAKFMKEVGRTERERGKEYSEQGNKLSMSSKDLILIY